MRIAYLAHLNQGRASGVVAKVVAQVGRWRSSGNATSLFVLTRDIDLDWATSLGESRVEVYRSAISRMAALTRLVGAIRAFKPDLVYMRADLFYPQLALLPPAAPVVLEINTDDLAEAAFAGRLRRMYHGATRTLLLRRARAAIFVTSELAHRPGFRNAPSRRAVIANSIDPDGYPQLPGPVDGPPRLLFTAGNGEAWQGFDKVTELARRRPGWRFDVVGRPTERRGLQAREGSPINVEWHDRLERSSLVELLASADVGLGQLALHRKGMDEACPLKTREYLAVGMPVVYAHLDADVDRLGRHVLRIANVETNIVDELDRITAFVERARGQRIPRSLLEHMTVAAKEEQRLALFESLAGR